MAYDIQDFKTDVLEKSKELPVLVDFWAEWCGPCRVLGPVLERIAEQRKADFHFAKVNTEAHTEVAQAYKIMSIPNVKLFIDGEVVDEFAGALPEHMINAWLQKALPSKFRRELAAAENAVASNDVETAKTLLQKVVSGEPSNERARILLAKIVLFEDAETANTLVTAIQPGADHFQAADSIRELGELLGKTKNPNELPEGAGKEHFSLALTALKNQNFDQALLKFIEAMAADRQFLDDGARKACIAIFKFLGEDHALTLKHRKGFSSALYI